MAGFDPQEPRDSSGRWTDGGSAIQSAASDLKVKVEKLMQLAKQSSDELQAVSNDIANKLNGYSTPVHLKKEDRIVEKALKEYNGDPEKITDLVRGEIVVEDKNVSDVAKNISSLHSDWRIKIQDGDQFLGYRSVLAKVPLANGLTAELQVSTPEMFYAKEKKEIAIKIIGNDRYNQIEKKVGLQSGLGHKYYEQYRTYYDKIKIGSLTNEEANNLNVIKEKSIEYYNHFR